MPTYTTRKFSGLALSSLVVGIIIIALVGWGVQSFFRTGRITAYYQLVNYNVPSGKPDVNRWATVNHTILIIGDNVVESILTLTAKRSPTFLNITVKVDFDDPDTYTKDDPVPQILEGNLSWSGKWNQDIHVNQTITILTKLRFDLDAKHFVGGQVISSDAGGSSEGYETFYYFTVEQGKIVKVTDQFEQIPPSTEIEATKLPL